MEKILNIAVIVAGIDEEYQNNIIGGINEFTRKNNINTAYFAAFGGMLESRHFDTGEYSIYKLANFSRFDGAILMTNTICDAEVKEEVISKVRESKIPAVVFDCSDYPEFINISIDNNAAMRDMVRHVITVHNAKTINFISGPMSNPEARARLQAFRKVMAENNLAVDESRIFYGEFRSHDGKKAVDEFIESGFSLPDAFICANDAMALTAVSTLEKYGYKIPDDVIVTGFDYTYSARNYCPALTSVERPLFNAGYEACRIAAELAEGKSPEIPEISASCVFTESCGCVHEDKEDFREYKKRTYKKLENSNDNIHRLNILTARLAEAETQEENITVIKNFIGELDCEKFALCLTFDWLEAVDVSDCENPFSYSMTAPLLWDKGKVSSKMYFSGSDMFPEKLETGGNVSYFLPLHFRERCFGYYIITNGDFPIYSLLCHTFSMSISNSVENIRKLLHLNQTMEELNRLYVIDPLCNLYNRNGFIKMVDDIFRTCVMENKKIMLTFIDMDGLKFINDNYGHNEGDFAIQRLAEVIKECTRPDSICARFGGDEFVVFDKDVSEGDDIALARRFNLKLESKNDIFSKPYKISASLGSIITTAGEDVTLYSIIKRADEAMYEIKKRKKNSRSAMDSK